MPPERPAAITKELSRNDTGETGGHQAGILIPKDPEILSFFPVLDPEEKNPRHHIYFQDSTGHKWKFAFIYYNNRFFGGTRNEYRLTGMTSFLRSNNLKAGDAIVLHRDSHAYRISHKRTNEQKITGRITLGSTWKVWSIKRD